MSSETVSEARSALQTAVAATDSILDDEGDTELRARALAGKHAMLQLCEQLSSMEDDTILAEVALNVPPAIQWLPHAIQRILATKVSLGQAIIAAARQTGSSGSYGDAHLVELANLNEVVRRRSSSPRVDLFSPAARPRLPQSRPKPIVEPPILDPDPLLRTAPAPDENSDAYDGALGAATPAPAHFFIGDSGSDELALARNLRVPSTSSHQSRTSHTSSAVLRRRAEVARRRAEVAALELAAEEAELQAAEASSRQTSRASRSAKSGANLPAQMPKSENLPAQMPMSAHLPAQMPMSANLPASMPMSARLPASMPGLL